MFLLFNPLPKGGDLVQEILKGNDRFLDHVNFLHQPLSLRLLRHDGHDEETEEERRTLNTFVI